ncbi:efhand domain-containing protein/EF_hand_3 domain-containing protein [Cephalotus follicularis]|uniref:Efhand domain-containing protein/EF_hand_3 domain-containing protein n=1 Tax=Cephalotus follicularis TaxID=3775 RepID=A0A1Q3D2P8_CEPFO|nr:efhand domain-containing protein/EF_hand_3 domain-containing protein [Cephalotus follicularis]
MTSSSTYPSQSYAPSAPSLPETYGQEQDEDNPNNSYYGRQQRQHATSYYGQSLFPAGTHPDVIRSFEVVDRDRSGFIDENELQTSLSSHYQRFSSRTIRLLMFLFKNPRDSLRIGPHEFAALWSCLGQWRAIFERFDRDRSGKIDIMELRDALYSIGYAIPPSVLQLLISKYGDGSGRKVELNFDRFVECGMIVKVRRQIRMPNKFCLCISN